MQVTGLLKGASDPPPDNPAARAQLAAQIGARPVWLAASTRAAEEPAILRAHAAVLADCPDLLLIIAPRQTADADATEAAASDAVGAQAVTRRSRGDPITAATQVYIADTVGEMGLWYRLVPVAYTGQSLTVDGTRAGGKNPFEAVALGVMVLHGPDTDAFAAAYAMLAAEGAAREVADADALARAAVAAQDAAHRAPYLAGAARVRARLTAPLEHAVAACHALLDATPERESG